MEAIEQNEQIILALRICGALLTFFVGVEILSIAYIIGNSRLIKFVKVIGAFFVVFAIVRGAAGFVPSFYILTFLNLVFLGLWIVVHRHRNKLKRVIVPAMKADAAHFESIDYVIDSLLGYKNGS